MFVAHDRIEREMWQIQIWTRSEMLFVYRERPFCSESGETVRYGPSSLGRNLNLKHQSRRYIKGMISTFDSEQPKQRLGITHYSI